MFRKSGQLESRNALADTQGRNDESRKRQSCVRPSTAQMLHLLKDDPSWLAYVAETDLDLARYQAAIRQWQADGCPDLGPLPELETPKPLPPLRERRNEIPHSSSSSSPLPFTPEVRRDSPNR